MSMFTRRHYVWLASVCRDMIYPEHTDSESDFCIKILANALAAESSVGFDREMFLRNIYAPLEVSIPSDTFPAAGPPQAGKSPDKNPRKTN